MRGRGSNPISRANLTGAHRNYAVFVLGKLNGKPTWLTLESGFTYRQASRQADSLNAEAGLKEDPKLGYCDPRYVAATSREGPTVLSEGATV